VVQYSSMADAMKDCCDNVWAVIEISGPSDGLDCSLFSDSGGAQYRSSAPKETSSNNTKDVGGFFYYGINNEIPENDEISYSKGVLLDDSIETETGRSTGRSTTSSLNNDRDNKKYTTRLFTSQSGAEKNSIKISLKDVSIDIESGVKIETKPGDGMKQAIEDKPLDINELRRLVGLGPSITVRMLPSAIPDTRNFEWSPRRSGTLRQQSGQLLYFLSGFLSIQLEVQNFISSVGLGGPVIPTKVFGDAPSSFLKSSSVTRNIADALIHSASNDDVFNAIVNTTSNHRDSRPTLNTPLYHRAFPTHRYEQQTFWHVYGSMIATALIVYFSLPSAVTAGAFRREETGGQLDSLSTLPGLRAVHSAAAWCLCSAFWSLFSFIVCLVFFLAVLTHTNALIPAFSLFLCGLSLGPIAMALGCVVKRADALVVAVPTSVFVTMLPGLLYVDLAFDVQRSVWLELLMCLLPPSGAALVLREVCGLEALNIAAAWTSPSRISKTPIYAYTLVLLFDCVMYSILAGVLIEATHRTRTPVITLSDKGVPSIKSTFNNDKDNDNIKQNNSTSIFSMKSISSYNDINRKHSDSNGNIQRNSNSSNSDINLTSSDNNQNRHRDFDIPQSEWTLQFMGGLFNGIVRLATDGLWNNWNRSDQQSSEYLSLPQQQQEDHEFRKQSDHRIDVKEKNWSSESLKKSPKIVETRKQCLPLHLYGKEPEFDPVFSSYSNRGLSGVDHEGTHGSKIGYKEIGHQEEEEEKEEENHSRSDERDKEYEDEAFKKSSSLETRMTIINLTKQYVTGRIGVVVLQSVSAELRQGTVTCLLGNILVPIILLLT
jgi:hypothetical protein